MKYLLTTLSVVMLSVGAARASDRVGVYALVDKVTLEPSAEKPERIQISGVFARATPNDRNLYDAPQRGYLYFTLPIGREDLARREWNDLKELAGTRKVVALGSRDGIKPRIRRTDEKPEGADVYEVNAGLVKIRSDTDYAPVKSLLEHKGR